MREPKKITELYAFVVEEPDGGDGVPAFSTPAGLVLPLMGADLQRIESLMPMAQDIANKSGRAMRILKSTGLEQVGTVEPQK